MRHHKQTRLLTLPLLLGLAAALHAGEGHRIAFVTSVTGTGDLGNWTDAGTATGTAAGDAICQARATAAGLDNPGNFVAWISDSSDDAYCRLHGLSGKRNVACGEATLPEAAGPWLRTDGFPFGAAIGSLLGPNVVFTPLRFDEFGDAIAASDPITVIATGTNSIGAAAPGSCTDWTDGTSGGSLLSRGTALETGNRWTFTGNSPGCGNQLRLACFERLPGLDLPPFAQSGRLAFLASASGSGELASWDAADPGTSGIDAGDSICRNLAADAGLDDAASFKAWLSDDMTDAIDRFENDGPWVRIDGVPIAASKADLTDEELFSAINVTEQGSYLGSVAAWTGTFDSGSGRISHCAGWTDGSAGESGTLGLATRVALWSDFNAPPCNSSNHLYCLSDPELPLFADRFEQP